MAQGKIALNVDFPVHLREAIEARAAAEMTSRGAIVRQAVAAYLATPKCKEARDGRA